MRRLALGFAAAIALLAVDAQVASPTAAARGADSPPAAAPATAARAWIVVDADTGAVVDASNERTPLSPASISKLFTALAAVAFLPDDATIPVSELTAAAPPTKLNMLAGEVWTKSDALHALLMSSANDAAAAIGETISGSLEAFPERLADVAARLGLEDDPVLWDPAGLDNAASVAGGNRVSARDIAIAARAVLREPELAAIVARTEYRFVDPGGEPHVLRNINKLLTRFPGAIGMKTGYTRRAGRCLVAAASRNGRTAIAVVLGATDTYGLSEALLAKALTAPPRQGTAGDVLPPVRSVREPSARGETVLSLEAGVSVTQSPWALPPLAATWPGRAVAGGSIGLAVLRVRARRRNARRQRTVTHPRPAGPRVRATGASCSPSPLPAAARSLARSDTLS